VRDLVSKAFLMKNEKAEGKVLLRTIYPLSGISDIGNAKIASQKHYGYRHINPRQRGNICKGNLENSHYGVENMLGNIGPSCRS
jgi:hypothetical protein